MAKCIPLLYLSVLKSFYAYFSVEKYPPPPSFFPPYSSRFFNSLVSFSIIVHDSLRLSVQRELLHILM